MLTDDQVCPCDSAQPYAGCCGRYHAGDAAPTAEALMRSRYSAFVLEDARYLLRTWHPHTRPVRLDFDPAQRWLGLKINQTAGGGLADVTGSVSFAARYKIAGRGHRMVENSSFERLDGRWVYLTGVKP